MKKHKWIAGNAPDMKFWLQASCEQTLKTSCLGVLHLCMASASSSSPTTLCLRGGACCFLLFLLLTNLQSSRPATLLSARSILSKRGHKLGHVKLDEAINPITDPELGGCVLLGFEVSVWEFRLHIRRWGHVFFSWDISEVGYTSRSVSVSRLLMNSVECTVLAEWGNYTYSPCLGAMLICMRI